MPEQNDPWGVVKTEPTATADPWSVVKSEPVQSATSASPSPTSASPSPTSAPPAATSASPAPTSAAPAPAKPSPKLKNFLQQSADPAWAVQSHAPITAEMKAYNPTLWEKTRQAVSQVPTGPGSRQTLGDVGAEIHNIAHRAWANPMGVSDEAWEADKAKIDKFFDDHLKETLKQQGEPKTALDSGRRHIAEAEAGLFSGSVKSAGEFMSPGQLALMVGTFGESALVRLGLKTGIAGAPQAARTLAKLMQLHFTASLVEGTATGIEGTVKNVFKGDWKAAGESASEALISGVMAKGAADHEQATARVRGDMEKVAREKYGDPEANPVQKVFTSRFDQLNPFQQGLVIDETVRRSPEYQAVLADADKQNEEAKGKNKKSNQKRLGTYYGNAMSQAWDPNVAARTIRGLGRGREAAKNQQFKEDFEQAFDQNLEAAQQRRSVKDEIAQLVDQFKQQRVEAARVQRKKQTAEEKSGRVAAVGTMAATIADRRQEVLQGRQEAEEASVSSPDIPRRVVESRADDQGNVTYPAMFWGEESNFGVAADSAGHAVYRQTPRGTEWLDTDGNFSETPDNIFFTHDPDHADTVARLTALDAQSASLAEAEGSTPEQQAEADDIAGIRRDLVNGEIDPKEARKRAGIADEVKVADEYVAARDGKLNGPFFESNRAEWRKGLEDQAREQGMSDEDVDALVEHEGVLARQQVESNLDHLAKPGDYIVSKRGVRWTLDAKGMLHPEDSSASPVPLLHRGMYSNDVRQLASSGRIGYGTETREQRRARQARDRQVESAVRENKEAVERELRLNYQNRGLEQASITDERGDEAEKAPRRAQFLSRPPVAPETQEARRTRRSAYRASSDPDSVINAMAARYGVTADEIMRTALAGTQPQTTEAKIANLQPGDTISDGFRKDRPWMVEEGKDGQFYLRSGQANPLPLDRLNPSDRIKQIVERGDITTEQAWSDREKKKAAFEKAYIVHQKMLAEGVKEPRPEPKTEEQAKQQAKQAEKVTAAAEAVATRAVVEATVEASATTPEEAESQVEQAQEEIHNAEDAYAQQVEAQAKAEPKNDFPPRAPVSIGLKGNTTTVRQNGREFSAHYELVPLDGLQTSHTWNGSIMEPNEEYPAALQPRTISDSESKQNAMRAQRKADLGDGETVGYEFAEYADQTINGLMGPAIVEDGGRVVGGNTRIAIMRKHMENLRSIGDPEEREAAMQGMKSAMRKLAQDVGIPKYPDDGTAYAVVRMLDNPIKDTREAAEIGRLFNKSVSVQITQSARGVSFAKALDKPIMEEIARRIAGNDGLVPAMRADPEFFAKVVTDRFGVTPEEYAQWGTEEPGKGLVLNDQGIAQFTKALMGTVIKDSALLNRIEGKTPYRALERAFGYMVQLQALPDRDITGKIQEALQAAAETIDTDPGMSVTRDKWLATYHPDQQQLIGMETELPPEPDRMTEALWRAMNASHVAVPRTLNDRLKNFIGEESPLAMSMFAPEQETPLEAFNRVFKSELKEVAHLRGDKEPGLSQEEFEAALRNEQVSDQVDEEEVNSERKGGRGESPEQPVGVGQAPAGIQPPPKAAGKDIAARRNLAETKARDGYVTPAKLKEFLETNPATKDHAAELYRTAKMMAEYVAKDEGIDAKEALDWVLRERLAGIESGELKSKRGQYSDPNIEIGFGDRILKLHKAADESTFIHEFAHVIFPLLSDEDLKEIDKIAGPEGKRVWDGERKSLTKDVYASLSEKLSHGLEKFLRDENPAGFTSEVKKVLAKVKEIMRQVYTQFAKDPLADYNLSEGARQIFADMFHISEFDVADQWKEEMKRARAEEKKLKAPAEAEHPLTKMAREAGAASVGRSIEGKVEDSVGERVDPRKPTVVFNFYGNQDKAVEFWSDIGMEGSKIKAAELVQTPEGQWGVRFNTKTALPKDVLFQDNPEKKAGDEEWIPVTRGTTEGHEGFKGDKETWFIQGHGPEAEAGAMSYAKGAAQAGGGRTPKVIKGYVKASATQARSEGDPIAVDLSKPENFRTENPSILQTPEFKRWFGDSKVKDKDGKPLRVYHGTTNNFTIFSGERSGESSSHGTAGLGFFFAADPKVSAEFASAVDESQWPPRLLPKDGANIVPVYLSIKNPYEMTASKWREFVGNIGRKPGTKGLFAMVPTEASAERWGKVQKFVSDMRKMAEDKGFDGIHVKGEDKFKESMSEEYGTDNWVAFKPEQIKSAIGNRGTFDSKDPSILHQSFIPPRHPGLELEELQKKLRTAPEGSPIRKFYEARIDKLKNEIRAKAGVEPLEQKDMTEPAKAALEEVKNGRANGVRENADAVTRNEVSPRAAGLPKPPRPTPPRNAEPGTQRSGANGRPVARVPRSLADVPPVNLQPLTKERGDAVGVVSGEAFDQQKWTQTLKQAGLPETLPAPTWPLSRKTADVLKFPGQKEVVQTALSALEQGDGAVVATATGSGKGYTSMGIAREWRDRYPNAKILYITKNVSLLKTTRDIATNSFGFEFEKEMKDAPGMYGSTYARIIKDKTLADGKWDLVIADESGEARRWYDEENKQGKALKDVMAGSRKGLYFSATPFHSPNEYGYMDKLNLWPKGGFDKWIENNFAHEKIDGKVIARLDPGKQAKLRQQLIERGQLVSQAISYDGFTAHFGVVPVTDQMKRGLDRIHEGFARAKDFLVKSKKPGLAEKMSAFQATYTKAFLERERLPQAIDLAKKARSAGWQVALFSETSSEDLFRRQVGPDEEPSTYQQLNEAMGGMLAKIIPPFEDVYDRLREEFGDKIGDYSGRGNSLAEREAAKRDFLQGKTPMLYTTYAAGGIGVSLHDADFPEYGVTGGNKPRIAIYLGPPYSGVLLEQAMGRFWRFGVKSDTHAVFLATDSEPDIRLMQQKVGPRMRALRAAVVGENDSLASAMSTYTDEEKVRARQESLAYQEGNEVAVNARAFQVRSKSRNVGINDWSTINFPPADTAKNKGMKFGQDVPGGDWSTLFQSKFGFMEEPPTVEEAAGDNTIDAIGNGLVSGDGMPEGVSVQTLDPQDRRTVTEAASAVAAAATDAKVDNDKSAAARQMMQAQLNLPGDKNKWELVFDPGSKKGYWRYNGPPEDITGPAREDVPDSFKKKNIRTWYFGNYFSQEVGIESIARQAGKPEYGYSIVRMNRSYQADYDTGFTKYAMGAHDIMRKYKLDTGDSRMMAELWDVVEGKKVSANEGINKAAVELADLHERIHDDAAKADVKFKTPAGATITWKSIGRDRNYMPHRIDWDAQVEDPLTGQKHKLSDIMQETFAEASRRRIIEAISKEKGLSYDQVVDYLRKYAPGTPVFGHIQRARTMDFPFIKKDWKTLLGYYSEAAKAMAIEENFGYDRSKLEKEVAKIPSENGRRTINKMFDGIFEPQEWNDITAKVYNAAVAFEAASKLTFSVAKVPFHVAHVPLALKGDVRPLLKAMGRLIGSPREVMQNAAYVGTLAHQLNFGDVMGQGKLQDFTHQVFGKYGFNMAYKIARATAGESARIWMEQYAMRDLRKGNAEQTRRTLKDTMLIGDKAIDDAIERGKWAPEDLAKAQTGFTNLTLWSDNPMQMPRWARLPMERDGDSSQMALNRAVRLTYVLQSFSMKSTSLVREQLYREVVEHKNMKPLAYALIGYPLAGQLLQAAGAATKGFVHRGLEGLEGKKHTEDSWDKFLNEIEEEWKDVAHGDAERKAVAFLRFYIDGLSFGLAWDRLRRWTSPLLNLAAGKNSLSLKEFGYLAVDELEEMIGGAYDDMAKQLLLGARLGQIEAAKHTTKKQKHNRAKQAIISAAKDLVPATKQIPGLLPPPKGR